MIYGGNWGFQIPNCTFNLEFVIYKLSRRSPMFFKKVIFFALILSFISSTAATDTLQPQRTGNSCLDPKMVFIPAGKFIMGSDEKEKEFAYNLDGGTTRKYGWYDIEVKKTFYLEEYCIDQTLVTNDEYLKFVKETTHRFPFISPGNYQKQGFLVHPYKEVRPFLWSDKGYPNGLGKHPVVLVSIDDASKYCKWKGSKLKKDFRLPTEEEWEKAARGTNGRYFPWGNQWDPARLNSWKGGPYFTTEIDKYPGGKSPYGLLDAAGNVFEWTTSTFPNRKHVVKSCSWDDSPGICRPAARHGRPSQSRHILIGFRCSAKI